MVIYLVNIYGLAGDLKGLQGDSGEEECSPYHIDLNEMPSKHGIPFNLVN